MLLKIYYALLARWERYRLRKIKFLYKGKNVRILKGFNLGHTYNLIFHDNVLIGENSFINARGGVEICSGTITGPQIMIYSENHIYNSDLLPFSNDLEFKKVKIGANCWIGARVFICPGVELGEGCVVAAAAVVTKSFPPLSVVGGNPARLLKIRNEEMYQKAKEAGVLCNDLITIVR